MRYVCKNCGWNGNDKELLTAPHPFKEDRECYGCPDCEEIDELAVACSIDGCPLKASVIDGVWYCTKHWIRRGDES